MDRRLLEFSVGIFILIGLACLAYLSFYLGDVRFFHRSDYVLYAKFSNVSGLTEKASVTIAGVSIGRVGGIKVDDGEALVTLIIDKHITIEEDAIAAIKSMGLIGEKYVAISPGASDHRLRSGDAIRDTQPPLDIEDLLGKFIFGNVSNQK
jgi:phospholipid/cholesterol/gamma-HCH transport system substrate-binding protein